MTKFLFCLMPFGIFAQSFIGLNTDNYSGVYGVLTNPANAVNSRTKVDINLIGISSYFSNDYASVNLLNFNDENNLNPTPDNNIIVNFDVLGPSLLFNINAKNAIALTTRARFFSNINNIAGDVIELFDSGIDENIPTQIENISLNATSHIWTEYGVTYARALINNGAHFLKIGITAKYLNGYAYTSALSRKLSLDYDPFEITGASINGNLSAKGSAEYSFSRNIDLNNNNEIIDNEDDYNIESQSTGFGLDLGIVYEYRKDNLYKGLKYKNKYFLKAGLAITDIGSLKYRNSRVNTYDLNIGVNFNQEILDEGNFNDIEARLNLRSNLTSQTINLPTAIHGNLDWNTYKKIYINLNTDLSLINANKKGANRIENSITFAPRFESRLFSIYSPVSYRQFSKFNWGTGFRLGPIYAGSNSLLSNLISDNPKSIDFYAGLKIPIYYYKKRINDRK